MAWAAILNAAAGAAEAFAGHWFIAVLNVAFCAFSARLAIWFALDDGIREGQRRAPAAAAREIQELREALEDARAGARP